MLLLVIRHAIAQSREAFAATGEDDDQRPLTEDGRRRMAAGAAGLHRLVPELDLIAASPLVRAQQTADIVAEEFGHLAIATTTSLRPESDAASFLPWLHRQIGEVRAVVGHEPHLGTLVTWLLTGLEQSRVPFRKGGACLLELASPPRKAEARLRWALTPSQLRRIGA